MEQRKETLINAGKRTCLPDGRRVRQWVSDIRPLRISWGI
jgi:hypothetical protein